MTFNAHTGTRIGQSFVSASRWLDGTTFINDTITVLVDSITADFVCLRVDGAVLVITITLDDCISIMIHIRIDRAGKIDSITILINTIATDFFGTRIDACIPVITINFSVVPIFVSVSCSFDVAPPLTFIWCSIDKLNISNT